MVTRSVKSDPRPSEAINMMASGQSLEKYLKESIFIIYVLNYSLGL